MPELSVVIPVYGCRDCLRSLHERLSASVASITPSYELIFVEDRGPDGSWDELQSIAGADPAVRALRLSRNFGQHRAITAGLAESSGDWVVVMDCDLEDPPEEIPRLYAKAQEGYDFVITKRKRRRPSIFRTIASRAYRWLASLLSGTDIDPAYTNFSVASRRVVDQFLRFQDQDRHYLLILLWLGFDHATVDVERQDRFAGRSSYTFAQLVRVASDGIFFHTTRLLRWIVYTGFVVALVGVLLTIAFIVDYVTRRSLPEGFTSVLVVLLLIGGFIIITVGVTGLYIGKIFNQVKGRPLYVVGDRVAGGEIVSGDGGRHGLTDAVDDAIDVGVGHRGP